MTQFKNLFQYFLLCKPQLQILYYQFKKTENSEHTFLHVSVGLFSNVQNAFYNLQHFIGRIVGNC